jgi:hypothetical protein
VRTLTLMAPAAGFFLIGLASTSLGERMSLSHTMQKLSNDMPSSSGERGSMVKRK